MSSIQVPHLALPFRFNNPSGIVLYKDMIMDAQPIAYWRLQSANAGLDSSMRGHTMSFFGGPTGAGPLINDPADQSLHFNGSTAYGSVPAWIGTGVSEFTMECWAQLDAIPVDYNMAYQIYSGPTYIAVNSGGWPYASYWTDKGQFAPLGPFQVVPNQAYHLVSVFDNGIGTLYVNGIPGTPVDCKGGNLILDGITYLGVFGTQYFWKGYLDEIAFYDRAMSDVEIAHHHTTGLMGSYLQQGAGVTEQNTFEEIAHCIEAIVRTPIGFRQDNLTFGFPHLELLPQPVLAQVYSDIISAQEPRADIIITEKPDQFDQLIDKITIQVGQALDASSSPSSVQSPDISEGAVP